MTNFRKTYAIEVFQYPTPKEAALADLIELKSLIASAGYFLSGSEVYQLRDLNLHSLLGKGKLEEFKAMFTKNNIDLIVIDFAIKPYVLKNIEDFFNIEVMDRTRVILEIFKKRATSAEGKLQVELAEAEYEIGRLSGGKGKELSRLGGGIGTRGPGEMKMEKDRRSYRRNIKTLKQKLQKVGKIRMLQYEKRHRQGFPLISIVGYTNAGKSTLLNALTKANVTAKNELFSTVDPTTRKLFIKDTQFLLTDTVGFIKKLPTELIEGFESTLEQITLSDLVLVVVDRSDEHYKEKEKNVISTLKKLRVQSPQLKVYNKIDQMEGNFKNTRDTVFISAEERTGLEELKESIYKIAKR